MRTIAITLSLAAVSWSCASELDSLNRFKSQSADHNGDASDNLDGALTLDDGPENIVVTLIGTDEVVATVQDTTCPDTPASDGHERLFYIPDGPVRMWRDNDNQVHMISPHQLTYAFLGPDETHLTPRCNSLQDAVSVSTQDSNPEHFQDASWPWATYATAQELFTVFHNEYHGWNYGQCSALEGRRILDCWYPSLTSVRTVNSMNLGTSPGTSGLIAKASQAYAPPTYGGDPNLPLTFTRRGFSDPSNIMKNPTDNLYYMAVMRPAGNPNEGMYNCIFRTADLNAPDSWRAFNGTAWTSRPQLGEPCQPMFPGNTTAPGSLHFSRDLGKFVYLGFGNRIPSVGSSPADNGFYMRIARNNQMTAWSDPILVRDVNVPWGVVPPDAYAEVYPSFINPAGGRNLDELDRESWLYSVRFKMNEVATKRQITRIKVRIERRAPPPPQCYRIGQPAYYYNSQGSSCSMPGLFISSYCPVGVTYTTMPMRTDHASATFEGLCKLPASKCYRVGGGGYWSNGQGASCPFSPAQMPGLCGGLTINQFNSLPNLSNHYGNVVEGPCG